MKCNKFDETSLKKVLYLKAIIIKLIKSQQLSKNIHTQKKINEMSVHGECNFILFF